MAALLEAPNAACQAALRATLDGGAPFVAAQAKAVAAGLAADSAPDTGLPEAAILDAIKRPNNILAICYLRALLRLQSPVSPLPVLREGDYHATVLAGQSYPSASATRRAYLAGDLPAAEAAAGYPLAGAPCHRPDALDALLLHTLRTQPPAALRALPDCTEGLENRLAKAACKAVSRAELLARLKTKRYAYARLNRLLGHALLGVTGELFSQHPLPAYTRLLGFRQDDRECLSLLNESRLPIITKAADGDRANPLLTLDARAYDLWALGAGLPAGLLYRQPVQIVP
jgi:predicted nucleotidyltransferase